MLVGPLFFIIAGWLMWGVRRGEAVVEEAPTRVPA
jgi:hypothetical protein